MPYIHAKIGTTVTKDQVEAFKTDMGEAIALFPGKSEGWLMVETEGNKDMWFAGTKQPPAAMVEVSLFGEVDGACSEKMTEVVCRSLSAHMGIQPDRIYVTYTSVKHWGWNGNNFG